LRDDEAGAGEGRGQREALIADALAGLGQPAKSLPCKWLYDAAGAALFERITRLPEYYPTRTELGILGESGKEMARAIGRGAVVVELGPGDGEKAVVLLRSLEAPAAYVPVDISAAWLRDASRRVSSAFPGLPVQPVIADFTQGFALPPVVRGAVPLGFFPGSTIGNFAPSDAAHLLARLRATLGPGAQLLLGVDLVKDPGVLIPAYDDAAGVTAAFNLNLLARLNREAGADFDIAGFRHRAVWNEALERVEMHLVSRRDQTVRIAGRPIAFVRDEFIHTENSHKFRIDRFRHLAAEAGWQDPRIWTDAGRLFSVWLLSAA
jgi:dimethylhistidine N-methyltransferase